MGVINVLGAILSVFAVLIVSAVLRLLLLPFRSLRRLRPHAAGQH
ncbi:hypothetical protein [Methylobacterium oryzisoli]